MFKPDLRKRAITRVFDEALSEAGLSARVVGVIDDKNRGLVAQLSDANSTLRFKMSLVSSCANGKELRTNVKLSCL